MLDRRHDRRRVVRDVVDDEVVAQARREHERRDPGARAPCCRARPASRPGPAARRGPTGRRTRRRSRRPSCPWRSGCSGSSCSRSTRWVLPLAHVRVAGVLVLVADGLDDAHRLERAVLRSSAGPAPRTRPRRAGARRAGRAGRERGEVVQRLVVELEQLVRAVGPVAVATAGRHGSGSAHVAGARCRSSTRARRRRRRRSTSRPSTRPSRRPSRSGGRRSSAPSAAGACARRRCRAGRAGRSAGSC